MPIGPWRLVGKRSLADRLVIAVAWLVMVAAVTLLAAGAMYSDAVARSGLLRTLRDAGPTQANIEVSALVPADGAAGADATVTGRLEAALGAARGELVRFGRSESFAMPDQPAEGVRNLAVFGFAERIEEHATLVDGAWPAAAEGPLQAAISQPVATELGLTVGTELLLTSRLESSRTVAIRIAAIYAVTDPADPYWWADPLSIEGVAEGSSFTTYGPVLVPRDAFLGQTIVHRADLRWRAFPEVDAVAATDLGGLRARVDALQRTLQSELEGASSVQVETGLPGLLSTAGSSLLVSRAGVLLLNIQLAVLAGYALLLVGALIVEQRRAEAALLRSRGASGGQLFRLALMEGLLLVVPAMIAAPLLAFGVLAVFEAVGPLSGTGLTLRPQITQDALLLGGLAALISLLALALPGLGGLGPLSNVRRAVGRQFQTSLPQRLGLDMALLVLALIGLWQLQQYGAPLTRSMRGSLGVDPLLIAAPTIGLLAGAVLALRILPLLAKALEELLVRRQGLGSALGARQLARRPLRYTRAALLLMVASAIGIFAATYGATWAQSQRDQVDYAVGADIRTTTRDPDDRSWAVASAYRALPAVEAALPVLRQEFQLGRTGGRGTLLALEPGAAASVVTLRPDLATTTLSDALGALETGRPQPPLVALADQPARLALDLQLDLQAVPAQAPTGTPPGPLPDGWAGVSAAAIVRDSTGLVHRFDGTGRIGVGAGRVEVPLSAELADGKTVAPAAPLELVAVEIDFTPPANYVTSGQLRVAGLATSGVPAGEDWTAVAFDPSGLGWQMLQIDATGVQLAPAGAEPVPGGLAIDPATPLSGPTEVHYTLRPETLPGSSEMPIPALVNPLLLDATGIVAGDQLEIGEQFSATRRIVVSGELRGFPTLGFEEPLAVVDLASVALSDYAERTRLVTPAEWWLRAPAADVAALAPALAEEPIAADDVQSHATQLRARLGDPIALGVVGALALGSAAAWFFAALGFIVSAAVATRERLSEFALLRALGLSRRQLAVSLSLENVFLLLISLGVGVGLGALLSWVVLPSVTLTAQGTPPLPPVRVALPWDVLVLLAIFGAALLLVTLVVLRRLSEQSGLGALLRMREE